MGHQQEVTCPLLIKASKCIPDHILGVCAIELLSKHCEEHGEVDGPRSFIHHGLQVVLIGIFACVDKHMWCKLNSEETFLFSNNFLS